jgi:transcriptional regulator with XRE-family HTH domain
VTKTCKAAPEQPSDSHFGTLVGTSGVSSVDRVEGQHYQWFMSGTGTKKSLVPLAFGREVRRRRAALGLTLEQLAERSGLTPNYIGTVENGRRDPSLSTVLALARGLGAAPGELLGGVGELSPTSTEAATLLETLLPDVQVAILELLRMLSRKRRVTRDP